MDNIPVKKLQTQKIVSLSQKKRKDFLPNCKKYIVCIEFRVNTATQSVSSSASRTRNVWCQHHTISKCEGTKAAIKKNQQTVNSEELRHHNRQEV